MNQQRQRDLEEILELLYEKRANFEKKLIIADGVNQEFSLKQQLKRDILPDIQKYESEYWELMTQDAVFVYDEDEQAAEESLRDVEAAVKDIERTSPLPTEVVEILRQIRDKLNEPQKPASAKLKATLPLIPTILSFELELNISNKLYAALEKIRQKKDIKTSGYPQSRLEKDRVSAENFLDRLSLIELRIQELSQKLESPSPARIKSYSSSSIGLAYLIVGTFPNLQDSSKFRVVPELCYSEATPSKPRREFLAEKDCSVSIEDFPTFFDEIVAFAEQKIHRRYDPRSWELRVSLSLPATVLGSPLTQWCGESLPRQHPIVIGCSDQIG